MGPALASFAYQVRYQVKMNELPMPRAKKSAVMHSHSFALKCILCWIIEAPSPACDETFILLGQDKLNLTLEWKETAFVRNEYQH
jgi:hypothetical protein